MPLPDGRATAMEANGSITTRKDGANPYSVAPLAISRASATLAGLSRRGRRKYLARAAEVAYLAVLDPASGVSCQDWLKAADGAARVSGLVREGGTSKVSLVVTFKGLRRDVVDASTIEARVVEAAGLPPIAGAAGGPRVGGGEGG